MKTVFRPVLLGLSAAVAAVVHANDQVNMDSVVVTAAGFEQKLTDAPASISVITEEQLRSRPYMTLLDAVKDLEGVDVGETRDKTGQGTISMRGMGSDYTLVLVNGRRQNNHGDIYPNNFGGNQFNHIPPLDAIERIEVIRGPASTLYGADAMGGVINVITKRDAERWSGSVTTSRTIQTNDEYGDDTTVDFSVMGPVLPGKLMMGLRGSMYDREASNPEYADVTDPTGTSHTRELGFGSGGKTVDNTNKAAGLSLIFTPSDQHTITFDYDTSVQVYDNDESQVGTTDNIDDLWSRSRSGYSDEQEFTRDQFALSHEGQWSFGRSTVTLNHVKTNNNGRTLPLSAADRTKLDDMKSTTCGGLTEAECKAKVAETFLPRPKRTLQSAETSLNSKLELPFHEDHFAVVGAEITQGELKDGVFGMEDGSDSAIQDFITVSVFGEDNWYVTDAMTLTAGARYDHHDTFGSQISPRLYSVYALDDSWTVKGGVSTGYKTPKTTDLYDGIMGFGGQGTVPLYGNPDLKAETSISSEVALYWQHPVKRHSFNVTLFENNFKDKISSQACDSAADCGIEGDYVDAGYSSYSSSSSKKINIDKATIKGMELAGSYEILPVLAVRANYTYTDSEQLSGEQKGYPLTGTAEHMANATLDWMASDSLNVFLTLESRSKRFRGFGRGNTLNEGKDGGIYYEDYEVLHLGAAWQALDNLTLTGRINNLLDEDFSSHTASFDDANSDGDYNDDDEVTFYDDYNNKDKSRNFWISANLSF
ncbi:TonB-dependent receptor domain-containing protein [Oceanospirillum sanctuarii]|uniref:TonB-dependent receptor domain-containing protein n=1 Tax=Oceanospirillum sanctuarii TaxID=1434821 RepID=UPI000A3A7BAD|nr:TonB-dependent receptor [Oceanospirillum sanctuarii]